MMGHRASVCAHRTLCFAVAHREATKETLGLQVYRSSNSDAPEHLLVQPTCAQNRRSYSVNQ